MPYETLEDLPDNIKKLPEPKQKQWLKVFNVAMSDCEGDDCEAGAIKQANAAIKDEPEVDNEKAYSFEDVVKAIEMVLDNKAGRRNNSKDNAMLQSIHDKAVSLGAKCDKPVNNSLKAISTTDNEFRVGNYIVLFGGRDLEGLATPRKNSDGSIGEHFTPETVLESEYTKAGQLDIDWEHGRAKSEGLGKNDVLGFVDWSTKKVDEVGVWVERVLDRRNKYVKWIEGLVQDGLIGTSSEPVQQGISKAANGAILSWPLFRDSLTVNPMEPRMLGENHIEALKALNIDIENDRGKRILDLKLKYLEV